MEDETKVPTAYRNATAADYDRIRFTSVHGILLHETELGILKRQVEQSAPGSAVLEVGCGTGRLLLELTGMPLKLAGVDASEDMLRIAREKLNRASATQTDLQCSEAAKLPFPDSSFDFVYAVRLLNQTESPAYARSVIAEMIRVSTPEGRYLIEFANSRRPRIGGNRGKSTRLEPREVVNLVRQSGGEVASLEGAFFFGMGAFRRLPPMSLPLLSRLDRWLARLLPSFCARVYVAAAGKAQ